MKAYVLMLLMVIASKSLYAQRDYNTRLSERLTEIRELTEIDNGVVVLSDSSGYGSTFPRGSPTMDFYRDDMATFKGGIIYRALVDNTGKNPATSPNEWEVAHGPHPYLFLRDSAKTEDLKTLLTADHPYIRVYAVASLSNRGNHDLFQVVVNNLPDTTRVLQHTSDFGYYVCPADLMLWYTIHSFSKEQKDTLKRLILTKYNHLNTREEVLLFHKPVPEEYRYVEEIAKKDPLDPFGLIALSAYQKSKDIELIRAGFKNITYYHGYKVFFKAIENFPDRSFKQDLIGSKEQILMDHSFGGDPYYFNALAAYKDQDCLKVLEDFVYIKNRTVGDPSASADNRKGNLHLIHQALKKHYTPMYDRLIAEIKMDVPDATNVDLYDNRLEDSAWNY